MEERQEGMEACLEIRGEEDPFLEAGRVGHQGDPLRQVEDHRVLGGTEDAQIQGGRRNQGAAQIQVHWV